MAPCMGSDADPGARVRSLRSISTALWLVAAVPNAGHAGSSNATTVTAITIQGMSIPACDIVLTQRGTTVHVLWDAFPSHSQLSMLGASASLTRLAEALVTGYAAKKHPAIHDFKVAIVEFPERDSYGTPRYELARTLGRFHWTVTRGKGTPIYSVKLVN